jgi:ABC-2 type transport system permease protein
MSKYLQLIKLTFQEYFVYRLNFFLWRFRSLVLFLSLFFFWLAVYGQQDRFLGYQKSQMMAYVIMAAFLRGAVLATRSADLAGQIRSGELTRIIKLPINMIGYWFGRDLVDKVLNIGFVVLEIGLILSLFNFPFYFPQNPQTYLFFGLMLVLAVFLFFFFSFFLSVTAFWTEDIWATRWLFGVILLNFFAGAIFPIDVLPAWLAKIISLTPFPYLVFYPIKIWLEQLSLASMAQAFLICLVWLIIFTWLSLFLWRKGAKNYGAYGG